MNQKTYFVIYSLLLLLLALTFSLAYIDLGPYNIVISMLIATLKALLVILFFMNIKHSSGIHRIFALAGVFWLGILLALSLNDSISRGWMKLP